MPEASALRKLLLGGATPHKATTIASGLAGGASGVAANIATEDPNEQKTKLRKAMERSLAFLGGAGASVVGSDRFGLTGSLLGAGVGAGLGALPNTSRLVEKDWQKALASGGASAVSGSLGTSMLLASMLRGGGLRNIFMEPAGKKAMELLLKKMADTPEEREFLLKSLDDMSAKAGTTPAGVLYDAVVAPVQAKPGTSAYTLTKLFTGTPEQKAKGLEYFANAVKAKHPRAEEYARKLRDIRDELYTLEAKRSPTPEDLAKIRELDAKASALRQEDDILNMQHFQDTFSIDDMYNIAAGKEGPNALTNAGIWAADYGLGSPGIFDMVKKHKGVQNIPLGEYFSGFGNDLGQGLGAAAAITPATAGIPYMLKGKKDETKMDKQAFLDGYLAKSAGVQKETPGFFPYIKEEKAVKNRARVSKVLPTIKKVIASIALKKTAAETPAASPGTASPSTGATGAVTGRYAGWHPQAVAAHKAALARKAPKKPSVMAAAPKPAKGDANVANIQGTPQANGLAGRNYWLNQ